MSTCNLQNGGRRHRKKIGGMGEAPVAPAPVAPAPVAPVAVAAPVAPSSGKTWEDRKRQAGDLKDKAAEHASNVGSWFSETTSSIGNSVKGFGSAIGDRLGSLTKSGESPSYSQQGGSEGVQEVATIMDEPESVMEGGRRRRRKARKSARKVRKSRRKSRKTRKYRKRR